MRKTLLLLALFSSVCLMGARFSKNVLAQEHPFMIVREEMYPELRSRSNQEPWTSMKQDAISTCQNKQYRDLDDPSVFPSGQMKGYTVREIVSACALAYILDEQDPLQHKTRLVEVFDEAWPDIIAMQEASATNIASVSPAAVAVFNSLLALDIIYNDLTVEELTRIEAYFEWEYGHFSTRPTYYQWPPSGAAANTIWLLYKNDREVDQACVDRGEFCCELSCWQDFYKNGYQGIIDISGILDRLSEDGVYTEGPGYGHVGIGFTRDDRFHLFDVLEFTGEDNTYYTDPRLINAYEWLYGYASTPNRFFVPFGDTADFYTMETVAQGTSYWVSNSHIPHAAKFSENAGKYAMWKNNGTQLPGRLLHYIFLEDPIPLAESAPSRIFPDGGAFFLEHPANDFSLYGALWNVSSDPPNDFHKHKDVNAIYISGYGEPLLPNTGFCGAPNGCMGYPYETINNRAVGNNVALINYVIGNVTQPSVVNDHQLKEGVGIVEGFTTDKFDYASGDSGSALPNGQHLRNFIFVHPQDSANGYFILFDELTAVNPADSIHLAFHPNTDNLQIVTAETEYNSPLGPNVHSNPSAQLSIFLGTQPDSVGFYDGALASWINPYPGYIGEYLFNTYGNNQNGRKNIVTVLFPFDQTHAKANMGRVSGVNFSGASIDHGSNIIDVALESSSATAITYDGISFQADSALYRKTNNNLDFYFVRQGQSFNDLQSNRRGFDSTQNISLYLKETQGNIVSPGTQVTFHYPGITEVGLNGQNQSIIAAGSGWVTVNIEAGTHEVELVTDLSPSPTPTVTGDINNDGIVNIQDYVLLSNAFGTSDPAADLNNDNIVNILDYTILSNNFGSSS